MTQMLILVARIEPQKRWLACLVLWVFIAAAGFVLVLQPRLVRLKKIQMDISTKAKQLELEKVKGKELGKFQDEVQALRLEKEKKEQEFRQAADSVRSQSATGTPHLVSFFSNLAHFAKQEGAKFVSIRPVDAVSSGEDKPSFVASGQKSVDVLLIGKYSVLSQVLYRLEQMGVLTTVKQFHVKPGQQGYPLLELQMRLEVIFG